MEKDKIRNLIKTTRDSLTNEEIQKLSLEITKQIIQLIKDHSINDYFIYSSFNKEVNTSYLISYLLEKNKNIYLPKIQNNNLLAIKYDSNTEMNINKFGINEPEGTPSYIDNFICIIPLLAVDKNGNRIGYGKGYYDRFLKNKNCLKIGICYDFQIITSIIPSKFDIPLDVIISEKQIINNLTKKRE